MRFGVRESTPQRQFLQRREPPQRTGSTFRKIESTRPLTKEPLINGTV